MSPLTEKRTFVNSYYARYSVFLGVKPGAAAVEQVAEWEWAADWK